MPIAVEVAYSDIGGEMPRGEWRAGSGVELTLSIAEQDGDGAGVRVGGDDVGCSIVVHVGNGERVRISACGNDNRGETRRGRRLMLRGERPTGQASRHPDHATEFAAIAQSHCGTPGGPTIARSVTSRIPVLAQCLCLRESCAAGSRPGPCTSLSRRWARRFRRRRSSRRRARSAAADR